MSRRKSYYGSFLSQYICPDIDVMNFITAHESATGQQMEDIQRIAICGFVSMLKGNGTTNGSDLWTNFKFRNSKIYPLCPTSDSVANIEGYQIELISQLSQGSYNNFLASDITPSGAKANGGGAKWFEFTVSPSDYSQNDIGLYYYGRDLPTNNGYVLGSFSTGANSRLAIQSRADNLHLAFLNFGANVNQAGIPPLGLIGAQHKSSDNSVDLIKNGIIIKNEIKSTVTTSTFNMYGHALNVDGTPPVSSSDAEVAMYIVGVTSYSANQLIDLNESVQWYQSNVITGGRNV